MNIRKLMRSATVPRRTYEVMMAAAYGVREETIVKKKVSMALVLVLLLMALAVGAIAAVLLSGKEFVERQIAPRVGESSSDRWTADEVEEILRIASAYDISLPEDMAQRLRNVDGVYKETLMTLFLREDWGFAPGTWRIEDQAWYDELLYRHGLVEERTRFLPKGDEISAEKALSVATAYIRDVLGGPADAGNPARYQVYMEYQKRLGEEKTILPCKWYIDFEPLQPTLPTYWFRIAPDGTVEDWMSYAGVENAESTEAVEIAPEAETPMPIEAATESIATVDALMAHWKPVYENSDRPAFWVGAGLGGAVLPTDADIPQDRALRAAVELLLRLRWESVASLALFTPDFVLYAYGGEREWLINLFSPLPPAEQDDYSVTVDAVTGEPKTVQHGGNG